MHQPGLGPESCHSIANPMSIFQTVFETVPVQAEPGCVTLWVRLELPIAAAAGSVLHHLMVPCRVGLTSFSDLQGASTRRRFSRARCRRDFTVPVSESTARAISSRERPSYSASIRT